MLDALFQSPVILARRLATLDRLSAGRLVVGIGQGWMEQEFEAAGVSMKRRGAGFEEHLLAMRAVWGPDPVSFHGRFYPSPRPTSARSRSAREGRHLMVGRGIPDGDRAGRTTGYRVDPGDLRLATVRDAIATFRAAAGTAGFDAGTLPVMLQVNGSVTAEPQDERGPLLGSPEQVAADLDQAAELGVDHVYWNTGADPLGQLPLLARAARSADRRTAQGVAE